MTIKKAVIPAAGLGTRMHPATKSIPKAMLPIVDKPTIQYVVDEAFNSGIEEIAIVVGKNNAIFEDYFGSDRRIVFIEQPHPLGLGNAILMCESFAASSSIAVLLADDIISHDEPCIKQLIRQYDLTGRSILGAQDVPLDTAHRVGIAVTDNPYENLSVTRFLVEKPNKPQSTLGVLGRYVLTPSIFTHLRLLTPGAGGEIQLTDAIAALLKFETVFTYRFAGKRYDIGDKYGYLTAIVDFALRHETLQSQFESFLKNKFTN